MAQQLGWSESATCQWLGATVAQDLVAAALILTSLEPGPAEQETLGRANKAAQIALDRVERRLHDAEQEDVVATALAVACSCAPMVEAAHPCHYILANREFQT